MERRLILPKDRFSVSVHTTTSIRSNVGITSYKLSRLICSFSLHELLHDVVFLDTLYTHVHSNTNIIVDNEYRASYVILCGICPEGEYYEHPLPCFIIWRLHGK